MTLQQATAGSAAACPAAAIARRRAARAAHRTAYRDLLARVAGDDVFLPTPGSILDCLTKAKLSEDSATGAELSKQQLHREDPQAAPPEEFSDAAIGGELARAAHLYAVAAAKYLRTGLLHRAFHCFGRATRLFKRAAGLTTSMSQRWRDEARTSGAWTALVRHELARRSRCRRRLSLGLLHRQR